MLSPTCRVYWRAGTHQVVKLLESMVCRPPKKNFVDFQLRPLSPISQVKHLRFLEKKPHVHLWRVPNVVFPIHILGVGSRRQDFLQIFVRRYLRKTSPLRKTLDSPSTTGKGRAGAKTTERAGSKRNRGMGGQDPEGSFCSVFVLVLSYFRGICLGLFFALSWHIIYHT